MKAESGKDEKVRNIGMLAGSRMFAGPESKRATWAHVRPNGDAFAHFGGCIQHGRICYILRRTSARHENGYANRERTAND